MSKKPDLTPIKSSMLQGYHYDPNTRRLTVQYHNGDTWAHDDVPIERAEAFAGALSPGGYFNSKIRGLYPGKKL